MFILLYQHNVSMYHCSCTSGTLKENKFNLHNCEGQETKYSIITTVKQRCSQHLQ